MSLDRLRQLRVVIADIHRVTGSSMLPALDAIIAEREREPKQLRGMFGAARASIKRKLEQQVANNRNAA